MVSKFIAFQNIYSLKLYFFLNFITIFTSSHETVPEDSECTVGDIVVAGLRTGPYNLPLATIVQSLTLSADAGS